MTGFGGGFHPVRGWICGFAFVAMLAGCAKDVAPDLSLAAETAPSTPVALPPIAEDGTVMRIEDSEALSFKYSWPKEAESESGIAALLRAASAVARSEAIGQAAEDQKTASANDAPFNPHSFEKGWKVEGDTPALFSLSAEFYVFTGGAHGMSGFEALLWDRKAAKRIAFVDLFQRPRNALEPLTRSYCQALNAERARKRGQTVPMGSKDPFDACPPITGQVIVPAGDPGAPLSRLRVLIGPYEAGPYAEGSYELSLPVTRPLIQAMKPAYRGAFRAG